MNNIYHFLIYRALYSGEEVAVKKIFRGGDHGRELEVILFDYYNLSSFLESILEGS